MSFKVTTALVKILKADKQLVVCKSGTSCGKTYNIIAILINLAATYPNKKITVVGVTIDAVRTCADLFCEIMEDTGRFIPQSWNITRRQYYFANKSTIIFSSFEKISTAKASGKRDILFINEGNHLNWEIANELITRTNEKVYIDYNPSNSSWIDTEIIPDPDCEVVKLHYTDNEQVHPNVIKLFRKRQELAKTSDYYKNWCKVYIDGERGILEGTIFTNFKIVDEIPKKSKLIGRGLDFGYTNDPSALSNLYLYDGEIYIEELIYRTGLTTNDLVNSMNKLKLDKQVEIYADSAQPSMIEEIRRAGYYIKGATKGKDSVVTGIDILQQYQINILKTSLNIINEFENYMWKKNQLTGEFDNVPIDKFNHCFIGDTLVKTDKGDIKIKDISIKDKVLTSDGYKSVLKVFNNGVKDVNKYDISLNNGEIINITATYNHKIAINNNGNKEWIDISKLEKGMMVYQHKSLTEKYINYIKMKSISQLDVVDYIEMFGNIIMEKYQMVNISTIKIEIVKIMIYQISNLLKGKNIYNNTVKKELKIILNGLKNFIKMELKKQKIGIAVKKELNGTVNTQSIVNSEIKHMVNIIVKYVIKDISKVIQTKDFVQIIANQNIEELINLMISKKNVTNVELNSQLINIQNVKTVQIVDVKVNDIYQADVYDIMVDDVHEYIANGILVHNCIDGLRYIAISRLKNKDGEVKYLMI